MNLKKLTKKTFIIAEIGKNFIQTEDEQTISSYLKNAKELVKLAKDAGADAVKFQTHNVEDEQLNIRVTSPHFKESDRYSWVLRNTLSTPLNEFWIPLKKFCDEIDIIFFSTPMSRGAAKKLSMIGTELWKVGSGDMLDFVMLDYLAETKKPIIFSSGMSTMEETRMAIDFLKKKNADIALLHCISKYPCPTEELNLSTIEYYKEQFQDIIIGFSDHSIGFESAVAAVALGAKIIEKHFSISRDLWGSDHKVSMTPNEFHQMVKAIREIESKPDKREEWLNKDIVKKGMGKKEKIMLKGEASFRQFFRKSLMAGKDLEADTKLTSEMIYAMRPQSLAGGLPSEKYEEVLGKTLKKAIKKYDPITFSILKSQ